MIARLQRVITATLFLIALAWVIWFWPRSPAVALGGFAGILFGYAAFLAAEFVLLRLTCRGDPAPQPSWWEMAGAWIGEVCSAPKVFCWRQPFRSKAQPDCLGAGGSLCGRRGVVFIHGFFCNRGFWGPWLIQVRERGHAFVAVNLEPVFGSIDEYCAIIDSAVHRVTEATGMPPILVCHSMGGLAARAWLRTMQADARVHHVITIGTPHHGTWLGHLSHVSNGQQMRLSSKWLAELGEYASEQRHARFTCWYSNCDNIVFPVSTATLPGADNRLVRGTAHVALAFHPEVLATSLAKIAAM